MLFYFTLAIFLNLPASIIKKIPVKDHQYKTSDSSNSQTPRQFVTKLYNKECFKKRIRLLLIQYQ